MNTNEIPGSDSTGVVGPATVDMKLEVVIIPVSDVDRSKEFYARLGWRLDADFQFDNGFRVVQFTPPGSKCSVQFGNKLTSAAPGSAQGFYLGRVGHYRCTRRNRISRRGRQPGVSCRDPRCSVPAGWRERSPQRPGARPHQLQFVCYVQRPGWQPLVAAGSHNASSRSCCRRHGVHLGSRPFAGIAARREGARGA